MATFREKERVLNVLSHFLDMNGVKFEMFPCKGFYKNRKFGGLSNEPFIKLNNGSGLIWCVINEATSQSKVYLTDNSGDKILYSTDDFVKMTDFVLGLPDLLNYTGGEQ